MTKEFNFKKEIRKISINKREEQIIKLVEEKFDKFIKKLKEELGMITFNSNKILNKAMHHPIDLTIDNLAGEELTK